MHAPERLDPLGRADIQHERTMQEAVTEIPAHTVAVKRCRRCDLTLPALQFYRDRTQPDGLQKYCIPCRRDQKGITAREAEERAKLEAEEAERQRVKAVWERIRNPRDEGWEKRMQQAKAVGEEFRRQRHRDKVKKWTAANPEKVKLRQKRYHAKHAAKIAQKTRAYNQRNPQKLKDRRRRHRLKTKDQPLNRMKHRVRTRTQRLFKSQGWKKWSKTQKMLGCSWEMLVSHLERQFTKGMNWKNYGEWHIDHIVPLASARDSHELSRLAHFTNLRPLWAAENMAKGDSIITCQPELTLCMH